MRAPCRPRVPHNCIGCGTPMMVKASHVGKVKYCTKACMAKGYSERMKGPGNPHFKDAGKHVCQQCGKEFQNYNKARKYCSDKCKGLAPDNIARLRAIPPDPRKPRKKLGRRCVCKHCGAEFRRASRRAYCDDHRTEARRAQGDGGGTKDRNHDAILAALRAAGAGVIDTHHEGRGMPDLIVGYQNRLCLLEIKNPENAYGRRGLSPAQRKWAERWKGSKPIIVRTEAEALAAIREA
jgi:hypothetical protein